jgi:hypothetical protein
MITPRRFLSGTDDELSFLWRKFFGDDTEQSLNAPGSTSNIFIGSDAILIVGILVLVSVGRLILVLVGRLVLVLVEVFFVGFGINGWRI